MNQAEARGYALVAAFLAGERTADDGEVIRAAQYLATRAQATLRAGSAAPIHAHVSRTGRLGPDPTPRPGDDVETWLLRVRDDYDQTDHREIRQWRVLNELIGDYRLHAAAACPLDMTLEPGDELAAAAREAFTRTYPGERLPW